MNEKARKLFEMIQKDGEFLKLPASILQTYMQEDGTELKSAARDLITDIMHHVDEQGLNAIEIVSNALEVYKEEKWLNEIDTCVIRIETKDDGDTYISKVPKERHDLEGTYLHFPMTPEGIEDLRSELNDYGFEYGDINQALEQLKTVGTYIDVLV